MDITAEDFRRHFDLLSDEALLTTKRDELVEVAQRCYDEEISRRGLDGIAGEAVELEAAPDTGELNEPSPEEEELTVLATYDSDEEARVAKETLDSAGIRARLVSDPGDMEGNQMQLMVASSDWFKSLDALGLQISDEELAAQAEAAGEETASDEIAESEP